MAKIQINQLKNARIYIDGNDFIAKAEEVDLPSVKAKTSDVKGLGLMGDAELPTGYEKMEAKIKFNGVYPRLMAIVGDIQNAHTVIARASLEVWEANKLVEQQAVKAEMRGFFKETPTGKLKGRENAEQDTTMSVQYYKLTVNDEEIIEFDVFNNILKIDGVDQLETYRNNIGG
jgi:P2 family phage contractile tail tube protein